MMTDLADTAQTLSFWAEEEEFWLSGPDFFRAHMVPDAVMYFPQPTGVLKGDQVLNALENAPRWGNVTFFDKTTEALGNKVRLMYRAEAQKDGAEPYVCKCESTYVKMPDSSWKLTCHKQEQLER